jgi:nucleoid DNA-binding protein
MSVTKRNIVVEISRRTGLQQIDSAVIVDGLLAAISRALIAGNNIEIRGFGRFKLKKRNAHRGRNPRTGENVEVKAGIKPFFQASRELKNRVNHADGRGEDLPAAAPLESPATAQ